METCQTLPQNRIFRRGVQFALLSGALVSILTTTDARAQTAYGVNAAGQLFSFGVNTPGSATLVGTTGITPDGIDFNPFNGQLYAFQLGATNSSLYTLNLSTGAASLVGSFASVGTGYNLTQASAFGFDFNPKTLNATNNSLAIRLIGNNGNNLAINSLAVTVTAQTPLTFAAGSGTGTPAVVGAAYTNNVAATSGLTTLYDFTSLNDGYYRQDPPAGGSLTLVGASTIDIQQLSGFDIFTAANGFNTGYLSTDATNAVPGAELYMVDVSSGTTMLIGGIGTGLGITDIAVQPVPEPSTYAMILGATILGAGWMQRGRRAIKRTA